MTTWTSIALRVVALLLASAFLPQSVWASDPPCYEQSEHTKVCDAIELCDDLCIAVSAPCGVKTVWFHLDVLADATGVIEVTSGCAISYKLFQASDCDAVPGTPVEEDGFPLDVGDLEGPYFLLVTLSAGEGCCPADVAFNVPRELCVATPTVDCATCFAPFTPTVGAEMLLTAWTRMPLADPTTTTYDLSGDTGPRILVQFAGSASTFTARPSGPIIDGWQRMELAFVVPSDAEGVSYVMDAGTVGPALFDDIRVSPSASSMKCYVYDPRNLRLAAELDERHFATMYEYDGEGRLTRIKKETERGIMTLQESRTFMPGVQP